MASAGATESSARQSLLETAHLLGEPSRSTAAEIRRVDSLVAHPGLLKYTRGFSTQELSVLSERGEAAFADPLTITHENVIIEGYAVWHLAKLRHRVALPCLVRHMDSEAALLFLLCRNRGSKGINDFIRIQIALELEPWFKEQAKANQRAGGLRKGSSRLTEADKLDVRSEVAQAAGVSAGNVSKVKQILQSAIPGIRDALAAGDVSISRAGAWAKLTPHMQARVLSDFQNQNGIRKKINMLLSKHQKRCPEVCDGLRDWQQGLRKLRASSCLAALRVPILAMLDEIDRLLSAEEVSGAS